MIPTAISQIIEQLLNAIVSVVGAAVLLENGKQMAKVQGNNLLGPAYSAAGGTLGPVAGALIGLLFLQMLLTVQCSIRSWVHRELVRRSVQSFLVN